MYSPQPTPRPEPAPAALMPDQSPSPGDRPYIPPPPVYSPRPLYPQPPQVGTGEGTRYTGERRGPEGTPRNWLRIPLTKPIVTYVILGALVAIYIPMMFLPETGEAFVRAGAKVNALVYEGEWWRLITATFLHGPLIHIFFNGFALFLIGTELEALIGRARFIAIYAISGLAGSVASFIFSPFDIIGVGASGAIFGLIGALAVYFGLHRRLFGKMGQAQFWNILIVIALNVGLGFSGIAPIDNSAHLGGLVAGVVLGYILCPRYALGGWVIPNVLGTVNTNRGTLPWVAAGLILAIVVAIFFVTTLLIRVGILVPVAFRG